MPVMQYKAMDERGQLSMGRMDAVNSADLEMRLRRLGLDLINHQEARVKGTRQSVGRVARRELISFCLQLHQLVSAGVPVVEGLSDLRDTTEDRRMRQVVAGLVEHIEGGKTLSGALAEYPQVFDHVFVNLVHAGELSGQVAEVLENITDNLKWQDEQAVQTKRLLTYPIFAGVVVMSVLIFLMVYIVPQLTGFVKTMGAELPLHTKVLIELSQFFSVYWIGVVGAMVLSPIVTLAAVRASPALQYKIDLLRLRLWIVGPIQKKIILARFATFFALMYRSGITVLDCLKICETLANNKAVEEATRRAGRQISDGASISAGFESTGLFPPLVLRMLRVGENTGALDDALMSISYFYTRDVKESIERAQALIVPVLTMVLGAIVLWVIISVLGPIYDLITELDV